MVKISEIVEVLEELAPRGYQEEYDNTGLLIGEREKQVDKVLITLDVTEKVVEEAVQQGVGMIISHHPLIFSGVKRLNGKNDNERSIIKAIRNDLAVYSIHTNLDNVQNGVNSMLCDRIGVKDYRILRPMGGNLKKLVTFCPEDHAEKVRNAILEAGAGHIGNYDYCSYNVEGQGSFRAGDNTDPYVGKKNEVHFEKEIRIETIFPAHLEGRVLSAMNRAHPYEEVAYDIYPLDNMDPGVGSGMIGTLEKEIPEEEFLKRVKHELQVPCLRHSPMTGRKIKKVAVCGGSGSFLLKDAVGAGADVFITADIKYHQYFEADDRILMVDAGHYETEQYTRDLIFSYLKEKFTNFALLISKVNTNPIKYL